MVPASPIAVIGSHIVMVAYAGENSWLGLKISSGDLSRYLRIKTDRGSLRNVGDNCAMKVHTQSIDVEGAM